MKKFSFSSFNNFLKYFIFLYIIFSYVTVAQDNQSKKYLKETRSEYDARMKWWAEARFGLFLHWGLYSVPAGEYNGKTGHAEWIRHTARIPLHEYNNYVQQFNPVKFNADEWVRLAKDAGMKYITITTKHHDGFCLFDSKFTDFSIMSTPFKRDIMKELSEACNKYDIKICWYYSIADWHHPDYIPYLDWEKDRNPENANFSQYVKYLKNQLKELLTNYGKIGAIWFDGGNENWTSEVGTEVYNYVRSLQPDIIINNRVLLGRFGMNGFQEGKENPGDFGTPEQKVPATGFPNVNWESCITMSGNWGYNKFDKNWKSGKELIQMLTDISSKGGNLLLNIGPKVEGVFPPESIERLKEFARWMKVNSDAIYATNASPFKNLGWGRCTQKAIDGGTRLYLHVFDWPKNGKLVIPAIFNTPKQTFLLSDPQKSSLKIVRDEDALIISVPEKAPDIMNTVVVLDIQGKPEIGDSPVFSNEFNIFVDKLDIPIITENLNAEIRYTLDGSAVSINSPLLETLITKNTDGKTIKTGSIQITKNSTLSVRYFKDGKPISGTVSSNFNKAKPAAAIKTSDLKNGLEYKFYEGDWNFVPDFDKINEKRKGVIPQFDLSATNQKEFIGFDFKGFIKIQKDDVYNFFLETDDGGKLYIDNNLLIDNDGIHPSIEKSGLVALAKGMHSIHVTYFQKSGGLNFILSYKSPLLNKQKIPEALLFHEEE